MRATRGLLPPSCRRREAWLDAFPPFENVGSLLDEREQVLVDLILVDRTHAMRSTFVDLQGRALDELGLEQGRVGVGYDLIVVALQDQSRDVKLLKVFSLIRFRKRLDAEVGGREARHLTLEPEGVAHALRDFCTRPVVAVERQAEIPPELRPVGLDAGPDAVEDVDGQSARISRCL